MRWACLVLGLTALGLLAVTGNPVMKAAFRGSTVVLLLAAVILFFVHSRRVSRKEPGPGER